MAIVATRVTINPGRGVFSSLGKMLALNRLDRDDSIDAATRCVCEPRSSQLAAGSSQ
jgi:hypothetical protein